MTVRRYDFFNNNTYIRMDNITSQKMLREVLRQEIRFTNIPCKLSRFTRLLIEHEKNHNNSKKRGLKIRYGSLFTFLLPDQDAQLHAEKLLENIIKEFDNLPYAAFFSKEGKATYMQVYICERPFISDGKEVQSIAKKDRYRNKLTGKICKKEDADTESLQVIYKAGDVISSETVYFLAKTGALKFATQDQFNYFIAKLKNIWISLLSKICKTKVEEEATFHKISRKESPKSTLNNVRIINRGIALIEEHFNHALYAIKYCECYDDKAADKLSKLHKRFEGFIRDESCVFNGYRLSLNRKNRKTEILSASVDLFVEKFLSELNSVFIEIVPQF